MGFLYVDGGVLCLDKSEEKIEKLVWMKQGRSLRKREEAPIAEIRLRQFAMKYYPNEELINEEIAISGKAVQMYVIEIEHMSGKEIQER